MKEALKKALKKTFDVELEEKDKIYIEHNYCNYDIVDLIIEDCNTKEKYTFYAFNTETQSFPY